jgi:hypothetical protein
MINQKVGKCVICGYRGELIKERCRKCYWLGIKLKSAAKQSNKIPIVSDELRSKVESNNAELNRWFAERREEMTGFCKHCNGVSCKDDDKYFKFSICHILPKAYFPSIATHESNSIELCFWGNSCHTQMDNKMLDLTEMACWGEIVIKFQLMYKSIAFNERRRIPTVLLEYLGTDL